MFALIRRLLFGAPLHSSRQKHERLSKFLALPVFSSDAVSSVAYGPQEVLITLAIAGTAAWNLSLPIGIMIAILVGIVAVSYRQTIFAYPHGGGSYIVAKDNIGLFPGLVAAASILTDYVLTVAVSIAAGIDAFIAAYPSYDLWRVDLCILAIAIVAFANLRGLRESGALFAGPTYIFIISLYVLIGVGLFKWFTGALNTPIVSGLDEALKATGPAFPHGLTLFLILRAFSSGCSALTGIEAIADGVPAFKPPESKNAAATMLYMAVILATLVLGITFLGRSFHAMPGAAMMEHGLTSLPNYAHLRDQTLVSQIAEHIFGRATFYYVIQWATTAILILAANTAFLDFPRLSSILAKDRCAPRQLASLGDKLVFSNGIVLLSIL
ncbi:MAG: APC family permease, partial [Armatimonadetes bacterium]|nr:APC family permease [Armatimonadota bacterium]